MPKSVIIALDLKAEKRRPVLRTISDCSSFGLLLKVLSYLPARWCWPCCRIGAHINIWRYPIRPSLISSASFSNGGMMVMRNCQERDYSLK
jgi:hypothetical protein